MNLSKKKIYLILGSLVLSSLIAIGAASNYSISAEDDDSYSKSMSGATKFQRIGNLESRIEKLEGKVSDLERQIENLKARP